MAGHNKWSKIRHKKAGEDKKKGKIFTRMGREIQVAAREGGSDPSYNATLRTAIERARAENMPADNIDRAIKRGAGLLPGQHYEEVFYEGYAPGGVAVLVRCLTDNRNRTAGDVRHAFSKAGGSLGESGCVAYLFEPRGVIVLAANETTEETLLEAAIEAGGQDLRRNDDDAWEVVTDRGDLAAVRDALEAQDYQVRESGILYEPSTLVPVSGETAVSVLRFYHQIDQLDDVQAVYANFEIDDEEFDALAKAV